jgi:hypothetical protein
MTLSSLLSELKYLERNNKKPLPRIVQNSKNRLIKAEEVRNVSNFKLHKSASEKTWSRSQTLHSQA